MSEIKLGSSTIFYELSGSGDPVILIHGFSLDHRMWQPQIDFLSEKHQVVTYDMRGFGKSSLPIGKYSHHSDLLALLDSLQLAKVTIIGLSLGGEVAIDFALSCPQYLNKLLLASSSLGGYGSTVDWDVHAKEVGIEEAKKNWLNHSVFAPTMKNETTKEMLEKIVSDYSSWHWLNYDPREKLQPTALTRLNEIKVPTEIIVGANDLSYYHDIAKILNKEISNSHLTIIPNSGHMVNLENLTEFNKVLQAVL